MTKRPSHLPLWDAVGLLSSLLLVGMGFLLVRLSPYRVAKYRGRGADLQHALLPLAPLRRADLIGASLPRANLRRADLRAAVLLFANLAGADLSGADLSQAICEAADLRGA